MKLELYERNSLMEVNWYWRLRARNGRIVADSGEGYHNRRDMVRMLRKIFPHLIAPVCQPGWTVRVQNSDNGKWEPFSL